MSKKKKKLSVSKRDAMGLAFDLSFSGTEGLFKNQVEPHQSSESDGGRRSRESDEFADAFDKMPADWNEPATEVKNNAKNVNVSARLLLVRGMRDIFMREKIHDNSLREVGILTTLLSSDSFTSKFFDLMAAGEATKSLDKEEVLELLRSKQFHNSAMDKLTQEVVKCTDVYSGSFDVVTRDTFVQVWKNEEIAKLISKSFSSVSHLVRYIIVLTSPRKVPWDATLEMESRWKRTDNDDAIIESVPTIDHFKKSLPSTGADWFKNGLFNLLFYFTGDDMLGPPNLDGILDLLVFILCQDEKFKVSLLFSILSNEDTKSLKRTDLQKLLTEAIKENGIIFDKEEIRHMTTILLHECDCCEKVGLTFDKFQCLLDNHPELYEALSESLSDWIRPEKTDNKKSRKCLRLPNWGTIWTTIKNSKQDIFFIVLMLCLLTKTVVCRVYKFSDMVGIDGSPCWQIMLARGAGVSINFGSLILLLLMCRPLITWVRQNKIGRLIPVDHHVAYHKAAGVFVITCGLIHAAAHFDNIAYNLVPNCEKFVVMNNLTSGNQRNLTFGDWLFTDKSEMFGPIPGWANPTGMALLLVLFILGIGAHPKIRQKGHFEVFYWTHTLYFVFWILMFLHCKNFFWWIIIPMMMFFGSKAVMIRKWFDGRGRTYVVSGVLLPSTVTQLIIRRKHDFEFRPGDWVFVNIPTISNFEWHPFTISSAPEQDDSFTLHIRGVGGWTKRLHEYFQEEQELIEAEARNKQGRTDLVSPPSQEYVRSMKAKFSAFMRTFTKQKPAKERLRDNSKIQDKAVGKDGGDGRNLSNVFNVVFDPADNGVDEMRAYRFLSHRPRTVNFMRKQGRSPLRLRRGQSKEDGSAHVEHGDPYVIMRPKTSHSAMRPPLEVFIDGPYGAPSSSIFNGNCDHAVLVATGIGVTPFASVLQSIMHRYWAAKKVCPNCDHTWSDGLHAASTKDFRLKKVDFIWINREQKSFEWFLQLLSQLEMEQAEYAKSQQKQLTANVPGSKDGNNNNFLDIHLYITAFNAKKDFKAITLRLALDLMHKKASRDLITGLKSRTQSGRPDWDSIFTKINQQNLGNVTVFYCGNPSLSDILAKKSNQHGFSFKKEIF